MFAFMRRFFERLDRLAGTDVESGLALWLDRIAFAFLVLTVVFAPHSIAATQTAWVIGMLVWIIRLFVRPRPALGLTVLDLALWGFFAWSVISSLLSYEPAISLGKLRGTAVFLIFYFVLFNIRSRRVAVFIALVMIASSLISAAWAPIERLVGRGVEIRDLKPESPLAKALLWEGDTILEVNGHQVGKPEDILRGLEVADVSKVKFYRPDFEFTVEVNRADLRPGSNALERLGIGDWKKSHNWRSKGFYGHYTTYAEVLQLIASLAFGLLIAAIAALRRPSTTGRTPILWLAFAVLGLGAALLLTVTRAPQLAFVVSAGIIVLMGLGRRWLMGTAVVIVPVAVGALLFLQSSRQVGFFDRADESTRYRQVMLADGVRLMTESPKNLIFGVGMDSIKERWREWGMFEGGRLPLGHFHSTPLQIAVERGVPALLLWITVLGIYGMYLWRGVCLLRSRSDWPLLGILLGCFGGGAGFVISGLVHYNLGDQEVAMVFFILMGVGTRVSGLAVPDDSPDVPVDELSHA